MIFKEIYNSEIWINLLVQYIMDGMLLSPNEGQAGKATDINVHSFFVVVSFGHDNLPGQK